MNSPYFLLNASYLYLKKSLLYKYDNSLKTNRLKACDNAHALNVYTGLLQTR